VPQKTNKNAGLQPLRDVLLPAEGIYATSSSEKRLARILLLMAEFGQPGKPVTFIPHVTQETLAEMVGTTRSRISFFMNCFRNLGFISYNGRIQVHKSLLNIFLLDQLPEHDSQAARIPPASQALPERSASRLRA
jgi:CRP/FNR family cyclic AMP-dependent transcriptional regulator